MINMSQVSRITDLDVMRFDILLALKKVETHTLSLSSLFDNDYHDILKHDKVTIANE